MHMMYFLVGILVLTCTYWLCDPGQVIEIYIKYLYVQSGLYVQKIEWDQVYKVTNDACYVEVPQQMVNFIVINIIKKSTKGVKKYKREGELKLVWWKILMVWFNVTLSMP